MVQKVRTFAHFWSFSTKLFLPILPKPYTLTLSPSFLAEKQRLALKLSLNFYAKNPIFFKKPPVLLQQKKQKAAK